MAPPGKTSPERPKLPPQLFYVGRMTRQPRCPLPAGRWPELEFHLTLLGIQRFKTLWPPPPDVPSRSYKPRSQLQSYFMLTESIWGSQGRIGGNDKKNGVPTPAKQIGTSLRRHLQGLPASVVILEPTTMGSMTQFYPLAAIRFVTITNHLRLVQYLNLMVSRDHVSRLSTRNSAVGIKWSSSSLERRPSS